MKNVPPLLLMSSSLWSSSCGCDTRRYVSPQLRFLVATAGTDVLAPAPRAGDWRTKCTEFLQSVQRKGKKSKPFLTRKQESAKRRNECEGQV